MPWPLILEDSNKQWEGLQGRVSGQERSLPDLRKARPDRGKQPEFAAPSRPWVPAARSAGALLVEWLQSNGHLNAQEISSDTEFIPEFILSLWQNTRGRSTWRRKGFFWLTVSEVPAHSQLSLLLQACDEEEHQWSKADHPTGRGGGLNPTQGHTSDDHTSSH